MIVLLGLPPVAMFASEIAIARTLAQARLTWVLGAGALLVAVAFAALARNSGRILFGGRAGTSQIAVPPTMTAALLLGMAASAVLGITAGPLAGLFTAAAVDVGSVP